MDSKIKTLVIETAQRLLAKPRVSGYTPASLAESVMHILSMAYDRRFLEKFIAKEFVCSGSRAWYLDEDMDFPTVVNRLNALVEYLYDEC